MEKEGNKSKQSENGKKDGDKILTENKNIQDGDIFQNKQLTQEDLSGKKYPKPIFFNKRDVNNLYSKHDAGDNFNSYSRVKIQYIDDEAEFQRTKDNSSLPKALLVDNEKQQSCCSKIWAFICRIFSKNKK